MLLLWQRFILFKLNLQIYMKIYDCFMFSDEKMILDIRLNVLNEYVDHYLLSTKRKPDEMPKEDN